MDTQTALEMVAKWLGPDHADAADPLTDSVASALKAVIPSEPDGWVCTGKRVSARLAIVAGKALWIAGAIKDQVGELRSLTLERRGLRLERIHASFTQEYSDPGTTRRWEFTFDRGEPLTFESRRDDDPVIVFSSKLASALGS